MQHTVCFLVLLLHTLHIQLFGILPSFFSLPKLVKNPVRLDKFFNNFTGNIYKENILYRKISTWRIYDVGKYLQRGVYDGGKYLQRGVYDVGKYLQRECMTLENIYQDKVTSNLLTVYST